jgi:hypothetical protein
MSNSVFHTFKAIVKRLAVLMVTVVMFLGLTQTAGMAANSPATKTRLGVPDIEEPIRDEDNVSAKEERREWQSRASAVREEKGNHPDTLGEKLNVDELSKGFDPDREAEKRSVPTP